MLRLGLGIGKVFLYLLDFVGKDVKASDDGLLLRKRGKRYFYSKKLLWLYSIFPTRTTGFIIAGFPKTFPFCNKIYPFR